MKKKLLAIPFMLVAFTLIFLASCLNQESDQLEKIDLKNQEAPYYHDNNSSSISNRKGTPENTISRATFNDWTTSWESHWNDQYISSFTMPLSNLQNIVNTPEVAAARFYLGYSANDATPHLILVGVDSECESMIGATDYIYNFTQPCPHACPWPDPPGTVFPSPGLTTPPENTISIATFNARNTSWESHWDDRYVESFTMSLSNLQNIVNSNGVVAARFFLGFSENDGQAHLTLVGVDANGYSMIGPNTNLYNKSNMSPPRGYMNCEGIF